VSRRIELAEPCPDDQKGDDDGQDPIYGRQCERDYHRHEEHHPRSVVEFPRPIPLQNALRKAFARGKTQTEGHIQHDINRDGKETRIYPFVRWMGRSVSRGRLEGGALTVNQGLAYYTDDPVQQG
jgi:hypothetical protein